MSNALPTQAPTLQAEPSNRPSRRRGGKYNEDRAILVLLSLMLLLLALPILLTLTYLTLNPETLQRDLTPNFDFSSWQPGAPVTPREVPPTP